MLTLSFPFVHINLSYPHLGFDLRYKNVSNSWPKYWPDQKGQLSPFRGSNTTIPNQQYQTKSDQIDQTDQIGHPSPHLGFDLWCPVGTNPYRTWGRRKKIGTSPHLGFDLWCQLAWTRTEYDVGKKLERALWGSTCFAILPPVIPFPVPAVFGSNTFNPVASSASGVNSIPAKEMRNADEWERINDLWWKWRLFDDMYWSDQSLNVMKSPAFPITASNLTSLNCYFHLKSIRISIFYFFPYNSIYSIPCIILPI